MATFPTLSSADILNSLQEIECPLPPDFDVDRPTSKGVITVYWWFWDYITGIELVQAKEAADLYMDNVLNQGNGEQEMYGEGLQLGVQYETLKQMMGWAMLDDFTYRDLRDPVAQRVRKILSALINFHLFQREQQPVIDDLEEQYHIEAENKLKLVSDIEKMHLKIEARKKELQLQEVEVQKLALENEERRKRLIRLKEMEAPALERMEAAKREKNTLQERTENVTMTIKQHDGEIARLRNRIVQSPDRVRQTLNDMAASLAALKDELLEIDKKAREHESRIMVAKKYEGDISSTIKLLDEWSIELSRLQETSTKLSTLQETHSSSTQDYNELSLRHAQLSRRLTTTSEQIVRQESTSQSKMANLRSKTSKLQETYESLMVGREELQAQQELKLKECRKVTEAIEEITKMAYSELDVAEAAFNELKQDVLTYSTKLNKALDSLNATIAAPFAG